MLTSLVLVSALLALKAEANKISNATSFDALKIPGCYLVSFKESAKNASKVEHAGFAKAQSEAKLLIQLLGKIKHEYSSGYSICGVKSEEKLRSMLKNNPHVKHIEQDIVLKLDERVTVNNPSSWGLDRIDQRGNKLDGKFTYDTGFSPVNVYVIDTGIRISHQQFQGRASYGYNALNNNFDSSDCNGHGTHVAATIGGRDYGVCRTCSLIAVKVFDCSGFGGSGSSLISAIDWVIRDATAKGIPSVLSMSLTGGFSQTINDQVNNAVNAGIVVVAVAGNQNVDACQKSPASASAAITVGAISTATAKSSYSNYGRCVDIFAPGDSIVSADWRSDSDTGIKSGTSMATPHVSGVAAILRSLYASGSVSEISSLILNYLPTTNAISGLDASSPNKLLYLTTGLGQLGDIGVKGWIDGYTAKPQTGPGNLFGWACNNGLSRSIKVHVYVGGPAGQGRFLKEGIANVDLDAGVSAACGTSGIAHRFSIPISQSEIQGFIGQSFFVYGVSLVQGYPNNLLGNGGVFPNYKPIGWVDNFASTSTGINLNGWACYFGYETPIDVHVYAGGAAGSPGSFLLKVATANVSLDASVSNACGTSGIPHRFSVPISFAEIDRVGSGKLFVHGIVPFPGGVNSLLSNAGVFPDLSVKGWVERFTATPQTGGGNLTGWACNNGISKSIRVHIYVEGQAGQGRFLKEGIANVDLDSTISSNCGTLGTAHRFSIPITEIEMKTYTGQKFFAYGITSVPGYVNSLLGNGGVFPIFTPIGWVDNFASTAAGINLNGWACNFGNMNPIDVHVYAGGAAGSPGSFLLKVGRANESINAAVSGACGTSGIPHRFSVPISFAEIDRLGSGKLFVHGIVPFPGGQNSLLSNAGVFPDLSVKGWVERFTATPQTGGGNLIGWACNNGISKSIRIHVYVGGQAGQGRFLKEGIANVDLDSTISSNCGTLGTAHRFSIPITQSEMQAYTGQKFFAYGITSVPGYVNNLLGNGGLFP